MRNFKKFSDKILEIECYRKDLLMNSGIYCIKNLINNKIYVGSSVNIEQRFTEHKHGLNNNTHHNSHLQRSLETKKKMSKAQKGKIISFEQRIKISNSLKGNKLSEETRIKIGKKSAGRLHSEETKAKIGKSNSISLKGSKLTKETKDKISKALRGKRNSLGYKHTEEVRKRMSDSKKGHKHSEETKKKMSEARKNYYDQLG